jgi:hypothetical protein
MKKLYFITLVAIGATGPLFAQGETMIITGIYQGKDLYIKNPFGADGAGFCIYEVLVNDKLSRDEINSSAFAIDFNILDIAKGSPVEIALKHKSGCKPLVLNPESLKPQSTFDIVSISMEKTRLQWTTEHESGPLPYIVEQFRWNKWVKIGEVQGVGGQGENRYAFEVTPHSGENKVRVKQIDHTGKPRISESVSFDGKAVKVSFEPKKVDDVITFSSTTRYEVFDKFGNLVRTGYGKTLDTQGLNKGDDYYINYDNTFGETFRKK